ncbi:hypothetical protein FRB97_003997 [Tulasnella sp. 331]|nr:hypothetical protein FRB97_003997 [Tulasnella sp. 331]
MDKSIQEQYHPVITIFPSTPSPAKSKATNGSTRLSGLTSAASAFLLASPPLNRSIPLSRPLTAARRPSPNSRSTTFSSSSYDSRPDSSATTTPLSTYTAHTSVDLDHEEACRSSQSGEFTDIYSMYSSSEQQQQLQPSASFTPPVRLGRRSSSRPTSSTSQTHAAASPRPLFDFQMGEERPAEGSTSRQPSPSSRRSPSRIELPASRTASPMFFPAEEEQPVPGYSGEHLLVRTLSRQPSSTSISHFHRPTNSSPGGEEAPSKRRDKNLVIVTQPISSQTNDASDNNATLMQPFPTSSYSPTSPSKQHLSPPPTPSRHNVISSAITNSESSRLSLAPVTIPRASSPISSRARTASAAPSAITQRGISENGDLEDVDSLHVRSTYARLEVTGVPGDGYQDGVERTRAKAPGYMERRATLWPSVPSDLLQQEVDFLSSLDRYGFKQSNLTTRQENRLVLLPLAPLQKAPAVVKTPPSSPPLPRTELKAIPPGQGNNPKEVKRIDKWGQMMKVQRRDPGGNVESWSFDEKKGKKLRERIYKGVPDRWRSAVWWTLLDGSRVESKSPPLIAHGSSRMGMGMNAKELAAQYREWIDRPSSHDIQIDLDVPRTISGHVMFHTRYGSGQRSLFHVLHSFSLVCQSCGYCQGMGPIAATLLCYLEPDRTYAALVRLHDCFDMHSIFSPGFPGLLESIYVQERLTEMLMPDVFTSFKKHMISSTSYATKWYITLFANTFPFQTQLRLWDAFILEGRDTIVIIALAIIWVLREHLASAQATFETILSLLSSFYVAESEDVLLTWMSKALGDKKLRAHMVKWRVDWGELVKSGKDGAALL